MIELYTAAGGLGDYLILTSVCKYRDDVVILIPKEKSRFAFLFRGIAKVKIVDRLPPQLECNGNGGDGTWLHRKLIYAGVCIDERGKLPEIKISDFMLDIAYDYLRNKDIKHIFVPCCSKRWAFARQPKDGKYWTNFLDVNNLNQYLLTGVSDNMIRENAFNNKLVDCDLELQAAIYKVVGSYIGVDTGDRHLMTAVGGNCEVHYPIWNGKDNGYYPSEWQYESDRIKYIGWNGQ